jgi:hydroxypyruvate reductase
VLEGNVYGLAIGKAAIPMMDALAARTQLSGGLAVTKFASGLSPKLYTVIEGGHPIPDERSLRAGERVLEFVSSLNKDDTLVCLISGGGSALVTAPHAGLTLDDLQSLTARLLASGARISEINTIRRHLDRVKGGGLVRATKAKVISLILSDVIGNPLEAIASGPTAPDPTTRDSALQIIERYDLENKIPASISQTLANAFETLKPEDRAFERVRNIIVGDNELASRAAMEQANPEGMNAEVLTNSMQGEARDLGVMLGQLLHEELSEHTRPFLLIAGGETTVTVRGSGKGGRNQELALAAMNELRGMDNVALIALATDGDDGPTDAAGAVVTGESASRAESLGLDAADHLLRNDAYPFFDALGDLLKPGPTGTNVNDLIFLFAL